MVPAKVVSHNTALNDNIVLDSSVIHCIQITRKKMLSTSKNAKLIDDVRKNKAGYTAIQLRTVGQEQ